MFCGFSMTGSEDQFIAGRFCKFLGTFCEILNEHAEEKDVSKMMDDVLKINKEMKTYAADYTVVRSSLTKSFYLYPQIFEELGSVNRD